MDIGGIKADGNIVSLDKRKATLRSKVLVDMLEYWQDMKPDGALPARSDIDPRRIEGALPYAFVLERLAPGVARIRVAGGHLTDIMGMEVRGMPLSALFQNGDRNKLMGLMDKLFTVPRSLELDLSARGTGTRKTLKAEFMALPLLDDSGMVTRALGCLVARGGLPNPPYRFQIDAARETDIGTDPGRISFAAAPLPKPRVPRNEALFGNRQPSLLGFEEGPAAFTNDPAPVESETAPARVSSKAPFLRVVK